MMHPTLATALGAERRHSRELAATNWRLVRNARRAVARKEDPPPRLIPRRAVPMAVDRAA
jgi:hypothetical protein